MDATTTPRSEGLRRAALLSAAGCALFALSAVAAPASAQFNKAYEVGYRPMMGLAGDLKSVVNSDSKRREYGAVRELAKNYVARLEAMIAALEAIGGNFKDGDNRSWASAVRSPALTAAKNAKAKAEKLRDKVETLAARSGDGGGDCLGEAKSLQESLAELSDEFKTCWKEHEARRQKLTEEYIATREKWWNATKDDRKPVDDLARKAGELREKLNERLARADAARKLYLKAQDECDKARSDLFRTERDRSPDEVKRKYDDWAKSEKMVKDVAAASVAAGREAADAEKAYDAAQAEFERAAENYTREAAEGDQLFQLVLDRHRKAFEMSEEYKPFSW